MVLVTALIDADAADGFSVAVEVASERMVVATNGGIVVLGAGGIVPCGGVSVGNVITQLEVSVLVVVAIVVAASIDALSQQVELGRALNQIGIACTGAGAFPGGCQRLAAEGCVQLIEGGKTTIGRRFSVIERAAVGRRAVRQCLARSDADRAAGAAEAAGIDEVGGVAQTENYIFLT